MYAYTLPAALSRIMIYPLDFIFNTIKKRIHSFMKETNPLKQCVILDRTSWFTVSYISSIRRNLNNLLINIPKRFYSINKLQKFIKVQKDLRSRSAKTNMVYKVNYLDCNATYTETSRQLKTRIAEHCNHIRWNTFTHSVITEYRLQGHEFDLIDEFEIIIILDEEQKILRFGNIKY